MLFRETLYPFLVVSLRGIRRNTEYSLFIRAETLISEEKTRENSDYLILHRKGKNGSTFPSFLRVMNLHIIMIINIKDHPQKYCILDQNKLLR